MHRSTLSSWLVVVLAPVVLQTVQPNPAAAQRRGVRPSVLTAEISAQVNSHHESAGLSGILRAAAGRVMNRAGIREAAPTRGGVPAPLAFNVSLTHLRRLQGRLVAEVLVKVTNPKTGRTYETVRGRGAAQIPHRAATRGGEDAGDLSQTLTSVASPDDMEAVLSAIKDPDVAGQIDALLDQAIDSAIQAAVSALGDIVTGSNGAGVHPPPTTSEVSTSGTEFQGNPNVEAYHAPINRSSRVSTKLIILLLLRAMRN